MPSIWYPAGGSGSGTVSANIATGSFGITIDGGGSTIATGEMGYISIPIPGTITKWRLVADQSGSCVIDLWKDTYGNFPPTVGDTITGSDKPTLSSSQKAESTALTGWTTSIQAGDVVGFNVVSATNVTRVNLFIEYTKTQ